MGTITKTAQVSIKDAGKVGEKTVRAVVTAPTLDRDGDVIDTQSLKLPLKDGGFVYVKDLTGSEAIDIPFLTDHSFSVENVIGSVREAYTNEAGELEVVFGVSSREKAQDMFTLLDEGHLGNAFSITVLYDYADVVDNTIYNAEVAEISLVFRGSNRDARLLAVTKSLLGGKMSELSIDKLSQEELAELKAKIAEAESKEAETTKEVEIAEEVKTADAEDAVEAVEEAEAEVEAEAVEAEAEAEVEEVVEEEQPNEQEKEEEMEAQKSVATKAAATPVSTVEQKHVEVKENVNDIKILTAKQISAMVKKDYAALAELNAQAKAFDKKILDSKAIAQKELTYTGNTELYLAEQLDRDVETAYGDFGNVGTLVTKINLTESPKYSRIVRDSGVEFGVPGFSGTKPTDEPAWSRFTLEPKPFAVIVAWNDHMADDAYINAYNEIVRDIAEAEAKLEDNLVLVYAGQTAADGTVYPAQGLNSLLGAPREVNYVADDTFVAALAESYGKIQSADRNNLSMVMSGSTWGKIALLQDKEGRPLWTGTGQTISMGALGNVNVRTSDVITDDSIFLGNFTRYRLAAKEGMQLRTSSEAVVGDLNLFTDDASAVRAVKRLEGGVTFTNAFVKLVTTS